MAVTANNPNIESKFISSSSRLLQSVACGRVCDCDDKKGDCSKNHQEIHIKVLLKLHHHRKSQSRFVVAKIRTETCSCHAGKAGRRGEERTWDEQRSRHDGAGIRTGDYAWKSIYARGYPPAARPIRHIRMAIPVLAAERDVLLG